MSGFEVNYEASQRMTRDHRGIAEDIEGLADSMATDLDGGEGSEFILNGLASLATAAGEVATVNRAAAAILVDMVDLVQGVDGEAEGDFRELEATVE